ncbi:hypothetical protein PDE_09985 [Penicillium oxalicum 114-2]|uniref:Zn(2)-C6 fungal-type domain-containing protein n=1 Tax=Penicillium oxalicum (strain 114-2 / CGMCC 5302) TaxID=933388 RepID=S7ZW99_PENO1|nr:hypothetical protein PDE_09985 [Penicillium oxalicum 114-2]
MKPRSAATRHVSVEAAAAEYHRDDPSNDQPRKKRRKYTARACTDCKRRKIKCNGQSPCYRCGRQNIDCVYTESSRQESMGVSGPPIPQPLLEQMSAMQDQINALKMTVKDLVDRASSCTGASCAGTAGTAIGASGDIHQLVQRPSRRRVSTAPKTSFQGPTTSGFGFDLAKTSLLRRGIVEENDAADGVEGNVTQEPSPLASSPVPGDYEEQYHAVDPLCTFTRSEALRLCALYEEEMGIMYPVIEVPELLQQVHRLYSLTGHRYLDQALAKSNPVLGREDMAIVRLVFACALTAEASGRSDRAIALLTSVRDIQEDCVWGPPELKSITILTLVSILHFQMDEETLAWRTIGIVERMCLEKGLHRSESLNHLDVKETGIERVLRLFWSIYILDMRWSFGTGMPFALEDTDIDPSLPEPGEETPYLRVMVRYSRIAAKVWKFVSAFNNKNEIKKDEMSYLDWQVLRWAHEIPESLRLDRLTASAVNVASGQARSVRRLRSLLYLRANQLRMLIYRPVLHTAAHISRYPAESETVVEIAKDTIRFITQLNETSDIYQLQQVAFNWFLVSALAVLFLAVAQAPSPFSSSCKDEFLCALELVKGFSTHSYVSQRLWRSMRSLRKLGPQLGLWGTQKPRRHDTALELPAPPGSSAFLPTVNPAVEGGPSSQTTPADGTQMTKELMEWFEAVGNLDESSAGLNPRFLPDQSSWQDPSSGNFMFDYGEDLSTVLRDFF